MIAAAIRLRAHPLPSENAIMSKRVTLGVIVGNRSVFPCVEARAHRRHWQFGIRNAEFGTGFELGVRSAEVVRNRQYGMTEWRRAQGRMVRIAPLTHFRRSEHSELKRPPQAAQFRTTSALRIPNSDLVPNSAFRIPH
jgi:hypothetical protein